MKRGPAKSFTLSENKPFKKIINEVKLPQIVKMSTRNIFSITLNGKSLKIARR